MYESHVENIGLFCKRGVEKQVFCSERLRNLERILSDMYESHVENIGLFCNDMSLNEGHVEKSRTNPQTSCETIRTYLQMSRVKRALCIRQSTLCICKGALYICKRASCIRKIVLCIRERALCIRKRALYIGR